VAGGYHASGLTGPHGRDVRGHQPDHRVRRGQL